MIVMLLFAKDFNLHVAAHFAQTLSPEEIESVTRVQNLDKAVWFSIWALRKDWIYALYQALWK